MPRPHALGGFPRAGGSPPHARALGAALTSLAALAATSLVAGPASAEPFAGPCALERTSAHHSEGLDSWNSAYPKPERKLDAVMVFLSFPDSAPRTTPKELTGDYFPETSRFFEKASYGRFTLRPHPQRAWIEMPQTSTAYEIQRDWDSGRRSEYLRDALKVSDPEVDFSAYDVVYFVADPDAPGVDSDATKVVNFDQPLYADGTDIRRIVTVFEQHPPDRNVLAHETGHVFDLPDLYHRPTDGKGDWDTYVGDWDVMGSQFGLAPDLFGWHKWKLGWLDREQVHCVQGADDGLVTLEPLARAVPRGQTGGTRLAVVRTGRDSAIAVEARGSTGNDRNTCTEGVLVYRVSNEPASGRGPVEVLDAHPKSEACWDESVYPQLADAPVRLGERFTVPGESVNVEVVNRSRTGAWTVRITT
ncbi:M6 family metalloprotease domain-containing protein [Streptomyces boluensis]|uniref:M6 family metalloprotease domain-containing protein n=1 Tax=Streptomyces boluensis TaxID=1775135 RepID=A0A964XM19_9ACTN|nr:M6 family metalloprotease domain-containing protein [Streptomyces boluensis]